MATSVYVYVWWLCVGLQFVLVCMYLLCFVCDVFVFISWCVVYNVPCSSRKQQDSNQKMSWSLFKFRLNLEGLYSLLGAVSAADPWGSCCRLVGVSCRCSCQVLAVVHKDFKLTKPTFLLIQSITLYKVTLGV